MFLFSAAFLTMDFSFDYYAACKLTASAKLFQLLPKVFIKYRKSRLSIACIFMSTLIFQNQWERKEKGKKELNGIWKCFLKIV